MGQLPATLSQFWLNPCARERLISRLATFILIRVFIKSSSCRYKVKS